MLIPKISTYCQSLEQEFDRITTDRKKQLSRLADYITKNNSNRQSSKIIVICTHNSRRSHFGQLWLAIGVDYYKLPNIQTYSGGTEVTAFNIRAVKALQKVGFQISTEKENINNPIYHISWNVKQVAYKAFSKKYDTPPNPTKKFAALLVCTQANKNCPNVLGANFRLALPYEDPKKFDNTLLEKLKYAERCREIAREMLYVLHIVKHQQKNELTPQF